MHPYCHFICEVLPHGHHYEEEVARSSRNNTQKLASSCHFTVDTSSICRWWI